MRRSGCCAVLVVASLVGAAPAMAQFGGIFGPPPRPPSNIPNQPYDQQRSYEPAPPSQPQYQPAPQYQPPPQNPPPQTNAAPYVGPGQGPIRSQPISPPPGVPDQRAAVPVAPLPAPQPGVNPAAPNPGQGQPANPPPPVDTTLQPGDEIVTEPPAIKIINPTAVFSGLDKITGRITSFDVAINETVQFGALQVTPRVCYTRPPTETPQTDAFVEVDEVTLQGEVKRIFTGWMFAASPGLHAVEHPIYDVWLKDCKGGATAAPVAEVQPAPAPANKPPPRPRKPVPAPRAQAPRD
jgi:hypothetical protein